MRKFGIVSISNTKKRIWSEDEFLKRMSSSENHPYVDNDVVDQNKKKVKNMQPGDLERISVPHGGIWTVACVDADKEKVEFLE